MILVLCLAAPLRAETGEAWAERGLIQPNAPVKASAQVAVHAAPEKVWALLTDIQAWPKWRHEASEARMEGVPAKGTAFVWVAGGTTIHSRVALVRAPYQIAWTGRAYTAHVIHVWTLTRLDGDETLVKTEESMDGLLLRLFYSSRDLEANERGTLADLKRAAER